MALRDTAHSYETARAEMARKFAHLGANVERYNGEPEKRPPAATERPKRSKGELYDEIWEMEIPPIVVTEGPRAGRLRKDGTPAVEVGPTAARAVLMAMARHTNPTRDQTLGAEGLWRCCPTVETLAELTQISERQVQMVLSTFVGLGYIEIEREGMRSGKNRPARPTWWRLRPDLWPRRSLGNGR